ncbi:hypothetical protein E3O06_11515 [Cryobacterium glaciale]|uniref:ADP ribosyltransferase domain-containing protein n=1 Tax=Cryobacterium glaciale TaxID=1259145 RepID=A0A4R8UWY8_9MICO|nr:hypothetical protein [Cryobacterium glaciale]TFB71882.1 hypothetical protein E3O06_11515 [Cryobacterium glaciale]
MSDLQQIGVTVTSIGSNAMHWATQLWSKSEELKESTLRAARVAGSSGQGHHAAVLLSSAATACRQASQQLAKVELVTRQYAAATGVGSGSVPASTSASRTVENEKWRGGAVWLDPAQSGAAAPAQLSADDIAALTDFTGPGYIRMNGLLQRNDIVSAQVAARVVAVSAALAKLPNAPGEYVRGATLDAQQLARYQPGARLYHHGFTSMDRAVPFEGNVIFHITSRTGKDVSAWSGHAHTEQEILSDRGTQFDVTSRYVDTNGNHVIALVEVGA